MLQITSGKLFTREAERRNQLRGTLYGNLQLGSDSRIQTAAGTLLATDQFTRPITLVYELQELIEKPATGPGVLVSHTIAPYINDFSAVVSFALNAVCSPDYELARRLLDGNASLSTRVSPQKLLRRTFDEQIWCQAADNEALIDFTRNLIGLERRRFLAAMRAIRTFVTGMHRVADDVELAYTLLVASIESLAQGFDGHKAAWSDYQQEKRVLIDDALTGAPEDIATKVRDALLSIEHTSLARRFRDFTLDHLAPEYFRSDAVAVDMPAGRSEMPDLLAQAYRARSRYVHNLDELPRLLTLGHCFNETIRIEGTDWLTFSGLSRLARWVIVEFVKRQPKVEKENYDYQLERAGIIQARMAPQYWIGRASTPSRQDGSRRLEGFLEQLSDHTLRVPNATVTDLRDVLCSAEDHLPSMARKDRRPYVALAALFNSAVGESERYDFSESVLKLIADDLNEATAESLLVELLTGSTAKWDITTHRNAHDEYLRRRSRSNGLRVARLFESAMTLDLAERYRTLGDLDSCDLAKHYLALAVENWPGHQRLRQFEQKYSKEAPIDWQGLLIPDSTESTPAP